MQEINTDSLLADLYSLGIEDIKIEIDSVSLNILSIDNKEDILPDLRLFKDFYGGTIKGLKITDSSFRFNMISNNTETYIQISINTGFKKVILISGSAILNYMSIGYNEAINIYNQEDKEKDRSSLKFLLWLILKTQERAWEKMNY